MSRDDPKFVVRLPPTTKAFIAAQAARNGSSMNSEIVRCIRDRMDRENAATGASLATEPAAAENHNTRKECCDAANT